MSDAYPGAAYDRRNYGEPIEQKLEEYKMKRKMKKNDEKNCAILKAVWEKGVVYAIKKEKVSEDFVWYLLMVYCGTRLFDFIGRKGAVYGLLSDALKGRKRNEV